jgi:hypothetical protein
MSFVKHETVSALLDSVTGDAEVLAPTLFALADRLAEIDDELATVDAGPSKSEILEGAVALGMSAEVDEYRAIMAQAAAMYRALRKSVTGESKSDREELSAEANVLAGKVRILIRTVETVYSEPGFANAFLAVVAKPEGSRLRVAYKNLPTI